MTIADNDQYHAWTTLSGPPMYLAHFGLSLYPFSATPDTRFYFETDDSRPAFNDLIKELNRPDSIVVITGQPGMGKTLLCRKLLNSLHCHRSRYTPLHLAYPRLSPLDMFQAMAHELGLDERQRPSLQDEVEKHLKSLHRAGRHIILIVDEAQSMPAATLDALLKLSKEVVNERQLIQVALFGQPSLQNSLESDLLQAFKTRVTCSWMLNAMDRGHVAQYLSQRLVRAGASNTLFSTQALDLLITATGGVPRLINLIAHKALQAAWRDQEYSVAKRHVRAAISQISSEYGRSRESQLLPWFNRIPGLRRG